MTPQSQPRKKKNSTKINLLISFIFHALLVVLVVFFAARYGILGKEMKKIAVQMVKEKPPEKPKEPEKPKVEPPKEIPKPVETPKVVETPKTPPVTAPPVVAPPATELPSFDFEGGKSVETSSDPVQLYKGFVEYTLRQKWNRPENMDDDNYVAEVDLSVDRKGDITDVKWDKYSGNSRWDESVRNALAAVQNIGRPPPTNFPTHITVRFDVEQETEPVFQ